VQLNPTRAFSPRIRRHLAHVIVAYPLLRVPAKEIDMNWEQIEGKWDEIKGQLRSKWGKLTDDDVRTLSGKKDMLVGKIQERYGCLKDEAERQVDEWIGKVGERRPPPPSPATRRH
jgi:uncharacterized protein YjbJ (UPF0337 family)